MKHLLIFFVVLLLNMQFSIAQDETDNWKFFSSREYNFSIKFPDYITEISTSGAMSQSRKAVLKEKRGLKFSFDVLKYSVSFGNKVVPVYCLSIYDNSLSLEIEEFVLRILTDDSGIYQESDITIDSLDFNDYIACEAIYENKIGGYTGIKRELFIQRNNDIIRFGIYNTLNEPYINLYDKVTSTIEISE